MYFKVKDGQFVGFDKFQEGNHAASIDWLNESKTYIPHVKKVNWKVEDFNAELKKVERTLDKKYGSTPRFPFNDERIKKRLISFSEKERIKEVELYEFLKNLERVDIKSFDEIFNHKSFQNWKNGECPSNKENVIQFYRVIKLLIENFRDLKR